MSKKAIVIIASNNTTAFNNAVIKGHKEIDVHIFATFNNSEQLYNSVVGAFNRLNSNLVRGVNVNVITQQISGINKESFEQLCGTIINQRINEMKKSTMFFIEDYKTSFYVKLLKKHGMIG